MPALAPGETRRLTRVRASLWLGLTLLAAACAKPEPARLAARADARYGTHGFRWLAEHDPSALVAWGVSSAELRTIVPDARIEPAGASSPCGQAATAHAALFVVLPPGAAGAERRNRALDCGLALYRDERVLVIAPR